MRLGVLDIGSNSAHLRVVDAYPGGAPLPLFRHKAPTRLAQSADRNGALRPEAVDRVVRAVQAAWSTGPLLLLDIGGGSMEIVGEGILLRRLSPLLTQDSLHPDQAAAGRGRPACRGPRRSSARGPTYLTRPPGRAGAS